MSEFIKPSLWVKGRSIIARTNIAPREWKKKNKLWNAVKYWHLGSTWEVAISGHPEHLSFRNQVGGQNMSPSNAKYVTSKCKINLAEAACQWQQADCTKARHCSQSKAFEVPFVVSPVFGVVCFKIFYSFLNMNGQYLYPSLAPIFFLKFRHKGFQLSYKDWQEWFMKAKRRRGLTEL